MLRAAALSASILLVSLQDYGEEVRSLIQRLDNYSQWKKPGECLVLYLFLFQLTLV